MLAALADDIDGDEELAVSAIEGETSLVEAIDRALDRLDELDDLCAAIKDRRAVLAERAARMQTARGRIRSSLRAALQATGLRRLERPTATLGLRLGQPELLIEPGAVAALPDDCLRRPPAEPVKAAIRARLEAGVILPGCHLLPAQEQINIRNT